MTSCVSLHLAYITTMKVTAAFERLFTEKPAAKRRRVEKKSTNIGKTLFRK